MPADADGELRELLTRAGLGLHADALCGLARSSVRLHGEPGEPPGEGPGGSRLGGRPDLPQGFSWPEYDGAPHAFVAQIDLAEIHAFDADGILPARGLLSFFYDSQQSVWGFDPRETGASAVHYFPDSGELAPTAPPAGGEDPILAALGLREDTRSSPFPAVRLRPASERTYAPADSSEVDALGLTRDERLSYEEISAEAEEDPPIHRLLGHPEVIQGDMQLECQLVTNGRYCGDASGYTGDEAERLRPGAADWRLLLQIDSDDDAGMMWGDVGRIYFWMHRDALAQRRWDEAHLILQCG